MSTPKPFAVNALTPLDMSPMSAHLSKEWAKLALSPDSPDRDVLTPNGCMALLSCGPKELASLRSAGLPHVALSHSFRFVRSEVIAWLVQQGKILPLAHAASGPCLGMLDACRFLKIGRSKFYEMIHAGEVPQAFNLGGRPKWLVKDLEAVLAKASKRRAPPRKKTAKPSQVFERFVRDEKAKATHVAR